MGKVLFHCLDANLTSLPIRFDTRDSEAYLLPMRLEKPDDLLKESYNTLSLELQKLMNTKNVLEGKETVKTSSLAIVPNVDKEH
ncbi:hypothetical protein HID58_048365 [Brassica napus]|uniref:Uncharacterized protein n=1 Tax=Brassica napus TaxID=3708 RepID=A0ABQ8B1Z5_BRANA|nr:hypothetical protein HID58_048365 [Brassica napus]